MAIEANEAPRFCRLRRKTTVPSVRNLHTKPVTPKKVNGATVDVTPKKVKCKAGVVTKDGMRRGKFLIKERGPDYCVVQGALNHEMLQRANKFLEKQEPEPARMKNEGGDDDGERKVDYTDRDCKVFWFHMREHCPWLQKHFAEIIRDVGNAEWPLFKVNKTTGNVVCEWEQTQYTVYGPGQHFFCWHQDAYADGHDQEDARQLTLVVMLSRKDEYDEGAFEMKLPAPSGRKGMYLRRSIRLDAGDIVLFPAKQLIHRVRPVSRGLRRTLVFWANDRMSCHFYNPKLEKSRRRMSK